MPGRLLSNFRRHSPSSSTDTLDNYPAPHVRHNSHSPPRYAKMDHDARRDSFGIEKKVKATFDGLMHYDQSKPAEKKKDKKFKHQLQLPKNPADLGLIIESPPLVFYNSPRDSSGALFSGQFTLFVRDPAITVTSFSASFVSTTTHKKPVHKDCAECLASTTELKTWNFLNEPGRNCASLNLFAGEHKFPLSYLIPGSLPATTIGIATSVSYSLLSTAILSTGEKLEFTRPLEIRRALIPGPDKHSIRIFPPTNLTAQVTLPSLIHPIGESNLSMRIAGVTATQKDSLLRWRLRKLQWRVEECQKSVSPACATHSQKLGGDNKGISYADTRVLSSGELKQGWKADDSDDTIELAFPFSIPSPPKPVCDMAVPNGLSVSHTLVLEMVVAEEWSSAKKPSSGSPTGAARVLRTQFNVILSERCGMGIAWDEEMPPVYEDVPASPPEYPNIQNGILEDVSDGEELGSVSSA